MKIWHGYGSEHSMKLVMIGHFKSSEDAEETQELINQLSERLREKVEIGDSGDRFSEAVLDILREKEIYDLSPSELEHFLYDTHIQVEGDKIIVTTDEFEVSAFFKLMILKGAKVEIFSVHHYPDAECGRGK